MSSISPLSLPVPGRRTQRLEDLFDAWVIAAHDATESLRAWAAALSRDRATAHAVYRAALDREESAADALMLAALHRR
jgi:hypothetical protein